MGCYQCSGPDGTDVKLCPKCREERANRKVSITEIVLAKDRYFRPYIRLIKEEWPFAFGVGAMMLVALNALFFIFFRSSPLFTIAGVTTVSPQELYETCFNRLSSIDPASLDIQSLSELYKEELTKALAQAAEENRQLDVKAVLMQLRAEQACGEARDTCTKNHDSVECAEFVKAYLVDKPEDTMPAAEIAGESATPVPPERTPTVHDMLGSPIPEETERPS